ncbi:unnamed protein product [Allacma fusca]|uniref:Cytochrome c oxidase subunit n=1 Tax=Allacma fusca TaxID=39272 RepID=A0A8J2PSK6_9HEXA|nr:unnamed protein product [Allacma fusca]
MVVIEVEMDGLTFKRSIARTASLLNSNLPFKQPKPGRAAFWKGITYFVCLPTIVVLTVKTFMPDPNVNEECKTHHERPKFVPYEYMRVRTKRFPWGDGNHSFFHNPKLNALPDGYEDEDKEE